jgi:hypothetical protein
MVKINPDTPGRIRVTFLYNPEIVARLKTVRNRRWHPDEKYWSFPASKPVLEELATALAGEKLSIDPALHSALLCNPRSGGQLRHSDRSGTLGSQRRLDDDDLYSRIEQTGNQRKEPFGWIGKRLDMKGTSAYIGYYTNQPCNIQYTLKVSCIVNC